MLNNVMNIISKSNQYVDEMECSDGFKLFSRSEISPYARCFAIFIKSMIKQDKWLIDNKKKLTKELNQDLFNFYNTRNKESPNLILDKPFLQLLCFTLSALNILNSPLSEKNTEIIDNFLKIDLISSLHERGVHSGLPGSGNHSMFIGILLLFARDFRSLNKDKEIAEWIEFNQCHLNENGFWGNFNKMTYLQFQNGYHQYEIFEYLNFQEIPWKIAASNVLKLADNDGHFAPYPGGGGCYDYDAIFMLTSNNTGDIGQKKIIKKTLSTIISEQNYDGGFCESKLLRHNNIPNIKLHINHIFQQPKNLRFSSFIAGFNLLRPKHKVVRTHWTETDRYWDESNLWDTFFRLSLIFRIYTFLDFPEKNLFRKNNFPGIG